MRTRAVLIAAYSSLLFPAARGAHIAVDSLGAQPAVFALDELRRVWFAQLNDLTATVRALAVADDTYEFVKRPNIPYVDAHYDPEHLVALGIDTVLIVDLHGRPLFWRRMNQGPNRGFADARLFLDELPRLPPPGIAGTPSFAGAATLVHGPKLLVAMPIYASSGSGVARGWLIAARALDAHRWRRYEEVAHVPVQLLDPHASHPTGDFDAALEKPLAPIVRMEAKRVRGFMAVSDLQGRPFRVFSVSLVRQEAAVGSVAASLLARSVWWLSLIVSSCVGAALIATEFMRRRSRQIVWVSAPQGDGEQRAGEAAKSVSSTLAAAPSSAGFGSTQIRLRTRLAVCNAVFRYQPQIDLQTGQIAGVEALLCIPGPQTCRPAIELAAEIDAAGLGLALVERRLRDACREQRAWLKVIGHDFPIGVPVSQRALVDAAFLSLVQKILAENDLAPSFLELQVEEAALGPSAAALRSITKVRDAGISVAIDGFNAEHSNLRLLSILPISKLRIDPYLLLRIEAGGSEALLFDGILGAARGLGIVVCATGISSPELLATLLRHARPLAQGAVLGAPLTADDFLELLRGSVTDTATLPTLDSRDARLQPDAI
jgi:EAL domain-containing protein (putative c-di-GMP-specific phosphodiesterase class I)/sensor domain CHASE-containing protein